MRLMMVFFVTMIFAACSDAANASGNQHDLIGKVRITNEATPNIPMDVEYNVRRATLEECHALKTSIEQTYIKVQSSDKFYKTHQGYFGQRLTDVLNVPGAELFTETYLGVYEKAVKTSHLGCYPVFSGL